MQRALKKKVVRHPVNGVLLLDKPLGFSSNQALQKVKWLFRAVKAGHTGTLDPLATGVLPICFGAATKFSQIHLDADKSYEAVIRLGVKTSTADAEGSVLQQRAVACTTEDVERVLSTFLGEQMQVPPMSSALKVEGVPLYELARRGKEVERQARQITIYDLALLSCDLNSETPTIAIRVTCSKGTYIRTLGEDIGEKLGCGGHLSALCRIQTGPFSIANCLTLAQIEEKSEQARLNCLMPIDSLLHGFERMELDEEDESRFLNGLPRRVSTGIDTVKIAVYGRKSMQLLGIAKCENALLIPERLLSQAEILEMSQVSDIPAEIQF